MTLSTPDAEDLAFAALSPIASATDDALKRVDKAVRDERKLTDPLHSGFDQRLRAADIGMNRFGYAVQQLEQSWGAFPNIRSISTQPLKDACVHVWMLDDAWLLRIKREPEKGVAEGTQRLFPQLPVEGRPVTVCLTWDLSTQGDILLPRFVALEEPAWTISLNRLIAKNAPAPVTGPQPVRRGPQVASKIAKPDAQREDG